RFLQEQVHQLGGELHALGFAVQAAQEVLDVLGTALVADQFELVAPVADFHRQALFDQAQVFVELSAEVGKASGFEGLEGEVVMLGGCVQGVKGCLGQKRLGKDSAGNVGREGGGRQREVIRRVGHPPQRRLGRSGQRGAPATR